MHLLTTLAALLSTASATIYPTSFANTTWDDSAWALTTTVVNPGHYQSRASLSNGYIGLSLSSLGPFFEYDTPVNGDDISGWPLFNRRQTFATIAGFYGSLPGFESNMTNFPWLNELGDESVISGLPHWSGLLLEYQGAVLNASTDLDTISEFSSTWDFRLGTLSWEFVWTPPVVGAPALRVSYYMFVHKLFVNQAVVRMMVSAEEDVSVTVYDVLDGDAAVRTVPVGTGAEEGNNTIWSAVQPVNVPYVTAYVYSTTRVEGVAGNVTAQRVDDPGVAGSNASGIAQAIPLQLSANQEVEIFKFVGIASTDAFSNPTATARNASLSAAQAGFIPSLLSHVQEWQSIFTPDSIDSYRYPNGSLPADQNIIDQQIMAVTNPYGILQNTVGANAIAAASNSTNLDVNSIAVCGLSADCYAGLIFWDAEVWMQPGLVVSHPQAAKQIANYRVAKFEQARKNVAEAYTSSQANTSFSPESAIFPWTSGRFGNCTGTGPCFDYEYHINGDIGLELENLYFVTGDTASFNSIYFPIYDAVAQVYSDLLKYNASSGLYSFLNATDPDEYANHVDNPGYTMVLIKTILEHANNYRSQFGISPNATWTQQAANLDIPVDNSIGLNLEYTNMTGAINVKQADVVLVDDFLDYENPNTLSNLDYYAGRQSPNGPGMTYGVFSIVASDASPSGCSAYTYDLYGSIPYARGPWYQYSEQLDDDFTTNGGTHPSFPFLTGMGGANRVAVFGYLGLRLRQDSFNINPSLPPQIPHLKYRTIFWQGHGISASSNTTHTTLTRLPATASLATANPAYLTAPIPVTIGYNPTVVNLTYATPLVIPNRTPAAVLTVPGNLAQCKPIVSTNATYMPGQFPLAAIDGAVSTAWQPATDAPSSITVALGEAGWVPVMGLRFDWGAAPPANFSVSFANDSDVGAGGSVVVAEGAVEISKPYDAANAAVLAPLVTNSTNVTLSEPVWGGKFATLTVSGNLNGTEMGGSVAEWAIVAA